MGPVTHLFPLVHPKRVTPSRPPSGTVTWIRAPDPVGPWRSTDDRPRPVSPDVDTTRPAYGNSPDPTGWTGWVVFASFIMIMLGVFQAIEGLVAIFDEGFYAVTEK